MRTHMSRLIIASLTVACWAAAAGCADTDTTEQWRGTVISVDRVAGYTASEVRDRLAGFGSGTGAVASGVDTFRVVYRTPGVDRRPTTASGLLALPRRDSRTLTLVSYGHGTTSVRSDVPSRSTDEWATAPVLTYAAAGFAAAAPDYLGLGDSPGRHPWMDVGTESSASLDLLRASRTVIGRNGESVRPGVMVTGFSQGASAAMGVARALDDREDGYLRLRAVAPVSGAYALRAVQIPAMLAGRVDERMAVIYTAYLLSAWNQVYGGIYTDPTQMFASPYAHRIDGYFSGDTAGAVMVAGLPGTLDALLTPRATDLLRHPVGALARALDRADSVCDGWRPSAPVRLFAMDGDEQAVTANTDRCAASLTSAGARVTRTNLPTASYETSRHLGSNRDALGPIVEWFAGMR
ncbi:hypothetical protein ACQ7HM_20530 [Williamsia sp. MIQD14]|uniref:hypothetical protein n=1 Tax=Williamsia sp. MIQD14 TaxID=3425703 RepID=UPI003D9FB6E0